MEQLILFETAKLSKDNGYPDLIFITKGGTQEITAVDNPPTQAALQKWLREKHKIRVFCTQKIRGRRLRVHYLYSKP